MTFNLKDIHSISGKSSAKRLAVLAPEDEEFLSTIKSCWEKGYIIPLLIGDPEKIKRVSDAACFSCAGFEMIEERDRQSISNRGLSMLFSGKVDMVSKGQIPTSFVYKSVIREEARINSGMTVCVLTMFDIPGLNRLVIFTDTGVNIRPDIKAKINTVKNAVFLSRLFGNNRPRVCALSGYQGFGSVTESYKDGCYLNDAAADGELGNCEILEAKNLSDLFLSSGKRLVDPAEIEISNLPDILLVPGLDSGNILSKLDFVINITRRSIVVTSRGPVIVPSRSDTNKSIVGEMAMGVAVCEKMKEAIGK